MVRSGRQGAKRGGDAAGTAKTPARSWRTAAPGDVARLAAFLPAVADAFGPRLIGVGFARSVADAPLDVVRIDLDRVRNSDLAAARTAVGEECVVSPGRFAIAVSVLPHAPSASGRKSPHDRGPSAPEVVSEVSRRLRKGGDCADIVFHDNVYGHSVRVLEREGGRYLLRTVSPKGLIERRRMGPEVLEYLVRGWWKA
jgi:hypothetical protein